MTPQNKTGKYIMISLPDSYDCSMERFDTLQELEIAVKGNYTGSPVVACKEIEQKLVLGDD